ncbi:MAG: hypothetical protein ACREEC_07595, partial [Thermoplasmata archaeon]
MNRSYNHSRRKAKDYTFRVLVGVCVLVALVPLVSIVYTTAVQGGKVFTLHFLTSAEPSFDCTPRVTGNCSYGGIGPAIEGSFAMLGLAALLAIPGGIA